MPEVHLKKGEKLYLPGGPIELTTPGRARFQIDPGVPFLRADAYIPEEEATTDTRQVYYNIQEAYLATSDAAREEHLEKYGALAGLLVDGNRSLLGLIDQIDTALGDGNYFSALKTAKELYEFEDLTLSASHDSDLSN